MYTALSANLVGLEGMTKVICNELGARYNGMIGVNHLGTDRVRVGCAELESRSILAVSITDAAESAELFNHRIGMVNTVLGWTKDGL